MKNLRIVIDPFCLKQFDPNVKTSTYVCSTVEEMQEHLNKIYDPSKLVDGYAPFCKHLFIPNFTQTKLSTSKITPENEHLLKTIYEARTEKELPVLRRYFPVGSVPQEVASHLDIILYSKEQIQLENAAMGNVDPNKDIDYHWGVVSVKPQNLDYEIPMDPITMMRNALGKEEGGSGVPLDRKKYLESVEFWSKNAIIKQ
ncbi:flagellar associated protein (macronuclear) [Tetrahymena thermophila SB210]|uniref:Flagellar associated protein n=1 Tax=Tetrahymena thermophila (strain SB210) TaxID=312017 RepID=Q231M6_TETTS|nr:flagellar associated protein [Tetrahymena thermophila SB210]EAR91276.1 flagellar associated protein [Tetrahymena thermophila SB210]|eukprot:XP_001011521.1 flagellar associated protein [Tetrahymena thermophila SB210]